MVTGASSGIGRCTAWGLARSGATVLVQGRDPERTAEVARLASGRTFVTDLTGEEAPERLAAEAVAQGGRVDLLVCNAGVGLSGPFTETTREDLDRTLGLDLMVPLRLVRSLLPAMVERGHGRVVLVGSVAGRVGVAGEAVYAAAKAGLDMFGESLRLELSDTGVGVTVVLPGVVDTPYFDGRGGMPSRRVPRPVDPEIVAEALVRAVADDRDEVWVPGWLRVTPVVKAAAPGFFRRMSGRFGEQVRIGRGEGSM